MAVVVDVFVLCPGGVSTFTRVFHWLAVSYGSLFLMSHCSIFRWVLPYLRSTTRAHGSGVRPAHLLDEPGDFWDSCHQNACVGGRIPKKNSTHTKVGGLCLMMTQRVWMWFN